MYIEMLYKFGNTCANSYAYIYSSMHHMHQPAMISTSSVKCIAEMLSMTRILLPWQIEMQMFDHRHLVSHAIVQHACAVIDSSNSIRHLPQQ